MVMKILLSGISLFITTLVFMILVSAFVHLA
jgi:hypothetical protein